MVRAKKPAGAISLANHKLLMAERDHAIAAVNEITKQLAVRTAERNHLLIKVNAAVALEARVEAHRQEVVRLTEELRVARTITRCKLKDERRSLTVKLRVGDKAAVIRCPKCKAPTADSAKVTSLHLTIGFDEDGRILEWFIRLDRDWRTTAAGAFADEWAKNASYALQRGGDLAWILEKARHARDDTAGVPYVWNPETDRYDPHPVIHHVGSVVDYCAAIIERVRDGKPTWKAAPEELAARQALQEG
jgi:hypothetical protein